MSDPLIWSDGKIKWIEVGIGSSTTFANSSQLHQDDVFGNAHASGLKLADDNRNKKCNFSLEKSGRRK